MTPEHRLAIEIMSECGKSPHEITYCTEWPDDVRPSFEEVKAIAKPVKVRKILPAIRRDQLITFRDVTRTAGEWMAINNISENTICYRRNAGWGLSRAFGIRNTRRKA